MKRQLILGACLVSLLLLFSACGSKPADNSEGTSTTESSGNKASTSEVSTAEETGTFKFAFLPNTQNNTFQAAMNETFQNLSDENGYEYVCLDPDYDLNTQLSQMADVANQNFDAVFVIPVDSAGIRQGLEQLNEKGIPIINVDTAVIDEDRELIETLIATDAYNAGVLQGQEMVKNHPDGAKIAILDFPSNESCVDRVNGFLEGLGSDIDKFDIVAQQDGKAALDASLPIAEDIIQANPDLNAFFCINDPSAMGAAAAIKSTGKSNIEVYSIDASPDGKAALLDGSFTSVSAQVPIQIAATAFEKAVALLNGEAIEDEIYLPSILVTKEMAEETAGQWQ